MIKCKLCNTELKNEKSLNFHLWQIHPDYWLKKKKQQEIKKYYNCKFCNKNFLTKNGLTKHIGKKHKIEKDENFTKEVNNYKFQCDICNIKIKTLHGLKTHIGMFHKKDDYLKYKCKECNKKFKTLNGLSKHIIKIHKIELFKYFDRHYLNNENEKYCHCGLLKNFINIDKGYKKFCSDKKCQFRNNIIEKKRSNTHLKKYNVDHFSKLPSERKKMSLRFKNTITKIKNKHPIFYKEEKLRYNPDKPGEKEIQVHCKNHNCENSKEKGGWFTPKNLFDRMYAIENGNGGSYFYCSEKCKQACPLYYLNSDPYKEDYNLYNNYEYQTFRQEVLQRSNNKCEYCGKQSEHVHHSRPQKLEPGFALDPDFGIACCKECHYKHGHKDECSTGQLANIICK